MNIGVRTLATAVATAIVVLVGGPAVATGPNEPDPPPCTSNCPIDNSDPVTGQVGSCYAAAGPSYIGLACPTSADHPGKTVKQILGPDPVPKCWDEPMSDQDLASMGLANNDDDPGGWTWYWYRCLHGITKKSKSMANATYDIRPDKVFHGQSIKTLTTRQKKLVDRNRTDSQVPIPVAGISPADHPRVRQAVAFFDGTHDTVTANAAGVLLSAHIDHIVIHPLGAGSDVTKRCDGTGRRAEYGETPTSAPSLCWYAYQRSSADQPDEVYSAEISAYWVVTSQVGGGAPQFFGRFTKSAITTIPVTDVQTLVVD